MKKELPHQRINFNLRPNKRIERRLIAEALMGLFRFDNLRRYGYVGMGSFYFTDFVLFHRMFGINKMVSVEYDTDNKARFKANKPYECVEMAFGETSDALPVIKMYDEAPVITWLDYYDRLTDSILGDIQTVLTRSMAGSVLLVTLNAAPVRDPAVEVQAILSKLDKKYRTPELKKLLGEGVSGVSEFYRTILLTRIDAILKDRNAGTPTKLSAEQLVFMSYSDGQPMVTIGWVLVDAAQLEQLGRHPELLDAPGVSRNEICLKIDAPSLTFREIGHLRSMLPKTTNSASFYDEVAKKGIPVEAAEKFSKLYRYYPSFADVEE